MRSNSSLWQMLLEWATLLSGVVACVEFTKWMRAIYRNRGCTANLIQLLSYTRSRKLCTRAQDLANIVMYGAILLLASLEATFLLWMFVSIFLAFLYPEKYFAENPKALLATLAVALVTMFILFSVAESRNASFGKVKETNIIYLALFSIGAVLGLAVSFGARFFGANPNVLGWTLMGAFGATGIMWPFILTALGEKNASW